eukprot:3682501-Prymnesium_polylepis.1
MSGRAASAGRIPCAALLERGQGTQPQVAADITAAQLFVRSHPLFPRKFRDGGFFGYGGTVTAGCLQYAKYTITTHSQQKRKSSRKPWRANTLHTTSTTDTQTPTSTLVMMVVLHAMRVRIQMKLASAAAAMRLACDHARMSTPACRLSACTCTCTW